jgi:fumarate reductase subunit C
MSLLALILILVCLGALLWAINTYCTFIAPPIKTLITIVIVIVALLLVADAFGLLDAIRGVRVPRVD